MDVASYYNNLHIKSISGFTYQLFIKNMIYFDYLPVYYTNPIKIMDGIAFS
jgi:hypothetical protein